MADDLIQQCTDAADDLGVVASYNEQAEIARTVLHDAAGEIEELRGLLAAAICPTCDGRGWYVEPGHACRNEQECVERCPEPIQTQCEWCDRRDSAMPKTAEVDR